jgi:hypothetical protein
VLIGNHWPFLLSEKPTGTFRETNHDGEITMANLTENFVQGLKVPDGLKDIQVFDDKLPGFGVRKYEKGHACYIVKFSVRGQLRKRTGLSRATSRQCGSRRRTSWPRRIRASMRWPR